MKNFILSFLVLTFATGIVLSVHFLTERKSQVLISHDSGIYDESISVSVRLSVPGVVYFTTNGQKPAVGEDGRPLEGTMLYTEPLELELREETSLYSLQFYCRFEDDTASDIYKRDYILDKEGEERFSTTYILSVVGEEEKLLGYEEGIFVRGRQFDEFMAENPDVDVLGTIIPGNYSSNAEVPVNAAFFLGDGTQVLSQNCGVRIYGNRTREKNQRSFRLVSRSDYADVNEFTYEFLPKLVSQERGTVIDAYQRLSLHNSGNDNGYAFIRTALIGELARKAGFLDVLVSESVTVYVNGRYMGVYWLENTYDDRYFKEKYGAYAGDMVICEGTLNKMYVQEDGTEAEEQYTIEYNEFCSWAGTADMALDDNWEHACGVIDIENFAQYMAIEYFACNHDWPHNNVKVYRYQKTQDESYREGTVFDGKYRYLLFDTDYGMGLKFLGWYGSNEYTKRLERLCLYQDETEMFRSLLQREEFRILFINSLLHLMNGSFSPQEISETLHEYDCKRCWELEYMVEKSGILEGSLWDPDGLRFEDVLLEMREIIDFAENRYLTVLEELQEVWNCGDSIAVSVMGISGGALYVGGIEEGMADYVGFCLENVPLEIKVEPAPGIVVTGYYVNSEFMPGETITLMPNQYREYGQIVVEPVTETEAVESLVISSYCIKGKDDYVVLYNNGQLPVLLSDYALTDSREKWSKGRLREIVLEPGEEYVVYGEKYSREMVKNSMQMPFSWNEEEAVWLMHVSKGIVDCRNAVMARED